MRYYELSQNQLEQKAEELLVDFDEERMHKTKPVDVYAVIEKCLQVPYDWKYLTPDQSTLGATAFSSGTIWVWPENKYYDGLLPYQVYIEKGTIIIDATLTESNNRGRENFTVMHEIFHQVLHKKCFRGVPSGYVHSTYSRTIDGNIRYNDYAMNVIERQANACAAAFLMPAELTKQRYVEQYNCLESNKNHLGYMYFITKNLSEEFSVSRQAMVIRLQTLGLIDKNEENLLK